MRCLFQKLPDGRWRCEVCGDETKRVYGRAPTQSCAKPASPLPKEPCVHRGAETRRVASTICCGGEKTRIKVFACAVHGECTIGTKFQGIQCCASCGEYEGVATSMGTKEDV
jgi:hypothetical protein